MCGVCGKETKKSRIYDGITGKYYHGECWVKIDTLQEKLNAK